MNARFAATKRGRVILLSLRGNQLTSLTLPDDLTSLALLVQVSSKALAGLVFEELQRQPVCVAMHPAHPLARERRVGLEQIAKERLIAFTHTDSSGYGLFAAGLTFRPEVLEHDS